MCFLESFLGFGLMEEGSIRLYSFYRKKHKKHLQTTSYNDDVFHDKVRILIFYTNIWIIVRLEVTHRIIQILNCGSY